VAVAHYERSGCYRLERQLPGGLSSSHWSCAPFSRRTRNLTYNALLDGVRLEDIELRRNDEAFLDGLGAQRIPDPTTSGDFTRRFEEADILNLMEITNTVRQRVWRQQPKGFLREALIDTDGTIAPTFGECKGGMALSYKGDLPHPFSLWSKLAHGKKRLRVQPEVSDQ
jgi:hypothetical protein